MCAAAPLKVDLNWSKIAVVKVSKRIMAYRPYSASRCRPTSKAPPQIARRNCGNTTRKNTFQGLSPMDSATSSMAGSSRRNVAATGKYRNGK
ncbi:hypothetical protein D9M71_186150 [compost metagenome]